MPSHAPLIKLRFVLLIIWVFGVGGGGGMGGTTENAGFSG